MERLILYWAGAMEYGNQQKECTMSKAMEERKVDTVESAIEAIKAGKLVIVVDDEEGK